MSARDEQPASAPRPRFAWRGLGWPVLVAGVALAGVAYIDAHNPHHAGATFVCPLYAATGLYCPGCGCTRAVYDLSHGDVLGAFSMNPLFVSVVPLLVALWVRWGMRSTGTRLREWPFPAWLGYAIPAVIVVFTVARNFGPLAPYLAP